MKKLLCAVLAIVTLIACLTGFTAAEEKPLPVYREVEDVPQKGNLTMRRETYPCIPWEESETRSYEKYMKTLNLSEVLPEKELPFVPSKYAVTTDLDEYFAIITTQEELACYYASLIEEWETILAEYKDARSLETITGHRAVVVQGDIMIMEDIINSHRYAYQKLKKTIDFETQAFIVMGNVDYNSKIVIDGNRLIIIQDVKPAGGIDLEIIVDKADLPAEGNEIEVAILVPSAMFPYITWETSVAEYRGYVTKPPRIFFDPVAE